MVTPHHLVLALAGSTEEFAAPPRNPFDAATLFMAALPPEDVGESADAARSVVAAGGRFHCARSLEAGAVLDELGAVQATDLAVRTDLLCLIRRTLERELAAGPIATLAVFEGLQRDPGHDAESRRASLPALHARLGSRLATVWCAGGPADAETVAFFTSTGLRVRGLLR
ncbi:hypothetical protein [Amycolatopsis sp. NPDC058986]|uniref:hypothetical protein n=1 Tax=unclassified Amycolatopsis TaxID=2618356 RepID=UPI00366E549B